MTQRTQTALLILAGIVVLTLIGIIFAQQYNNRPTVVLAPTTSSTVVTMTPSSTTQVASSTPWVITKTIDLAEVVVHQECPNGQCNEGIRVFAQRKQTGGMTELYATTTRMAPGEYRLLSDAEQVGTTTSTQSSLLVSISGIAPCSHEMMGCGPSLVVPLQDIGRPATPRILTDSSLMPRYQFTWNPALRIRLGLDAVCEGGCVPEPIYAWSLASGISSAATTETAYVNSEHFDGRTHDSPNEYLHWGNLRWIDNTHFQAELVSSTGTVRIIRGEAHE